MTSLFPYSFFPPWLASSRKHIARALLFAACFMLAFAQPLRAATVTTDKPDYPPGSIATITGSGFASGETITLQVLHTDVSLDNDLSDVHLPWQITAEADGSFQTIWLVPGDQDEVGASLEVTATGVTSGLTASAIFTDASVGIDFSQYVNGSTGARPGE